MTDSSGELETIKCKSCGAPADPYKNKCEYCGCFFKEQDDYEDDYETDDNQFYEYEHPVTMSIGNIKIEPKDLNMYVSMSSFDIDKVNR